MSVETALKVLGVSEGALFDEILRAKKSIIASRKDDPNAISQAEAAYDMLLMQSLNQRRAGKVVSNNIRYAMLNSMQTFTRLQTQIQARRDRLSEENIARHRLIQQKGHQKEHNQNQSLVIAGDFDSSNKSKALIQANVLNRKEAYVRRERAMIL